MTTKKEIIPHIVTHPGVLIKDELEALPGLNQRKLAMEIGVKPSFLSELINGKRSITADIAILLEKSLGIPADYWMKFQSQYEIDKARLKEKNIQKIKNIELWNIIKEYVPVRYFKKNEYLDEDIENNIKTIKQIYNIESIDELVDSFSKEHYALFRKSDTLSIDEINMFAWSSLAHYEAKKMRTDTFNYENINQLSIRLNEIFYKNRETTKKVKELLMKFGIKLLFIDKLEKTPIDGYSFWSDNNPAIALTLRHNRIDNFAFTIMHEIGHIDLHLRNNKSKRFIDITNATKLNNYEIEANEYAQEKLISTEVWTQIIKEHSHFSDKIIITLAKKYKINPAILLGRISHEFDNFAWKTKINKKMQ